MPRRWVSGKRAKLYDRHFAVWRRPDDYAQRCRLFQFNDSFMKAIGHALYEARFFGRHLRWTFRCIFMSPSFKLFSLWEKFFEYVIARIPKEWQEFPTFLFSRVLRCVEVGLEPVCKIYLWIMSPASISNDGVVGSPKLIDVKFRKSIIGDSRIVGYLQCISILMLLLQLRFAKSVLQLSFAN